jgi:3-oxoacyl-[acyl-carrier-protein] synthase-3
MVTQSPDYFLPSTACVAHKRLGLADSCAAFDVGLGCSGYPYGLWLAGMMLNNGGFRRVLLLHGETPSRFADRSDRAVSLLFGDAGSATALETPDASASTEWSFGLHTDGAGYGSMIVEAGGFRNRFSDNDKNYFVRMNGAEIFNFTIKRLPELIQETLTGSGKHADEIDYFIFHQSNRYIINYLVNKLKIPGNKVPMTLGDYGNTGGPSLPLTITEGGLQRPPERPLTLMLLAYGVGLSWSSAIINLDPGVMLRHEELAVKKE